MAITDSDKQFSLINILKPFDISFPIVSGGFDNVELGGWIHAGYTPDVALEQPVWSTRIWHLRERDTEWVVKARKSII